MLSEEDLIQAIMRRRGDLSREQLLKMVDEKLAASPFLTRSGALLIILEGERIADELHPQRADYAITEIANLTPGLRNLKLVVRLLGITHTNLKGGRRLTVMRVGDRTGVASALLWDGDSDRVRAENPKPGEILSLINFNTVENRLTGSLELVAGRDADISRGKPEIELPPISSYFTSLSHALQSGEDQADIRCVLLFTGPVESVRARGREYKVARLVVGDGEAACLLTLWGDLAQHADNLKEGEVLFLTSLRREDGGFSSTHRTTIHTQPGEAEYVEAALARLRNEKRLRVLHAGEVGTICSDGDGVYMLAGAASVKTNDCMKAINTVTVSRRGRRYIYFQRLERLEAGECPEISSNSSLTQLPKGDLVLDCNLLRRGQLSTVPTRYGVRQVLNLWLEVGGRVYPATAWGRRAEDMAQVPEGAKLRIILAKARESRFGEVEITIEDTAAIQLL